MALNDQLEWYTWESFPPGWWNRDVLQVPVDASARLEDAVGMVGGGLKPGPRVAQGATTNINGTGTTEPRLQTLHSVVPRRDNTGHRLFAVTFHHGANPFALPAEQIARFWEADSSTGAFTWVQRGGFASTTFQDQQPWMWVEQVIGNSPSDVSRVYVSTPWGIYRKRLDTTAIFEITPNGANAIGPFIKHQSRMVAASSTFPGRVVFTPAQVGGSDDFAVAEHFFDLIDSAESFEDGAPQDRRIRLLGSLGTSDLLVATRDGQFYLVQGDLRDPIIRVQAKMPRLNQATAGVNTADGFIFPYPGVGLLRTRDGANFENLSPSLDPRTFDHPFVTDTDAPGTEPLGWVTAPIIMPGDRELWLHNGLIYNMDLQTFSRVTNMPNLFEFHAGRAFPYHRTLVPSQPYTGAIWLGHTSSGQGDMRLDWALQSVASGGPLSYPDPAFFNEIAGFSNRYRWTSAPLEDGNRRRIEVREVQVICYPVHDSSQGPVNMTVTVGGQARTRVVPPRTPGSPTSVTLRFFFNVSGSQATVDLQAFDTESLDPAVPPLLSNIRVGYRPLQNFR